MDISTKKLGPFRFQDFPFSVSSRIGPIKVTCLRMSTYMFNNQISAISYRFAEISIYASGSDTYFYSTWWFLVILFPMFWPTGCLSKGRSYTIALHFDYVKEESGASQSPNLARSLKLN